MKNIPEKYVVEMSKNPFYGVCALSFVDGEECLCDGRITWHHPITFGGSQVVKPWATVPLCEFHHKVNKHQDDPNSKIIYQQGLSLWVILCRGTDEEIQEVNKCEKYDLKKKNLITTYGVYNENRAIEFYKFKAKTTIANTEKEWYLVPEEVKPKIQKCIEIHKAELGERRSRSEVITLAINNYYEEMMNRV